MALMFIQNIYRPSKIHISRGSDFSKSDFAIWLRDYRSRGLTAEYFSVLYFSAIFQRRTVVLQPHKGIEGIQSISS